MRKRIVMTVVCVATLATLAPLVSTASTASATTKLAPIVVGGQGDLLGFPGLAAGFQARITRFNKAGGLDGRKIKFLGVRDDGYSVTTSLTNAHILVQNEHVFADAPFASLTCVATQGNFLKANRTPFIGQADCGSFLSNRWGFGVTGLQDSPNIQGDGAMKELIQLADVPKPSDVKLAVIGVDVPVGVAVVQALAGVARKLGATIVYSQAPVPLTVTNFQPYAQAIVASGANAEFDALAIPDVVGLSAALKAANYKGIISNGDAYFPGQLASNPSEEAALDGSDITYQWPVAANNSQASRQQAKDLVAIGQAPDLAYGDSVGYWSADLLIAMLQATAAKYGVSGVTPERMQKVASHGFTYRSSLKGGLCPVAFPKSFDEPVSGYTAVQQKGDNYVQKIPFECGYAVRVGTS